MKLSENKKFKKQVNRLIETAKEHGYTLVVAASEGLTNPAVSDEDTCTYFGHVGNNIEIAATILRYLELQEEQHGEAGRAIADAVCHALCEKFITETKINWDDLAGAVQAFASQKKYGTVH